MFLRSMKQRSTLWSIVFTISGLLLLCVGSVALSLDHWEQNSDFWPVLFLSIVLLTFGLLHLFSVKVLLHSNNVALKAPQSPLVAVVEYIHVKPQLLETSTQKRPSLASTTTLPIGFLPSKNSPHVCIFFITKCIINSANNKNKILRRSSFACNVHYKFLHIKKTTYVELIWLAKTVAHFHTTGQQAPLITVQINKNKYLFYKTNEVTKPQKGKMRSNKYIIYTSMVEFVVHWKRAFFVGVEFKSKSCSLELEDSTESSCFASSAVAALPESIPLNWSRSC
ncbi:hypothetical protein T06_15761 [Trichinella sp. T6]|nr:hypothetical protein T06_15761 [Trichinella sp. T6]